MAKDDDFVRFMSETLFEMIVKEEVIRRNKKEEKDSQNSYKTVKNDTPNQKQLSTAN